MKQALSLILILFAARYASHAQSMQWTKSFGGAFGDQPVSVALDAAENSYTAGHFYGTADFDPGPGVFNMTSLGVRDAFVLKLDPNGNFVWAIRIGGTNTQEANEVSVDAANNVYIGGRCLGVTDLDPGPGVSSVNAGPFGMGYMVKLTSAGNFIWGKTFGGTGTANIHAIEFTGTNGMVCSAGFDDTVDFDPGAGTFNLVSAGSYDICILSMDTAGNFNWAKRMGGTSTEAPYDLKLDPAGNVIAVGGFDGTADFDPGPGTFNLSSAGPYDAYIVKLNSAGNFVWAKSMGSTGNENVLAVTIDASGAIYSVGTFRNTVDFDPGPGVTSLTSAGQTDIFVLKLDNNGLFQWVKRMGGPDVDLGNGIDLDASGNILTTGAFVSPADFDPGAGVYNLTATTPSLDIYVSKLSSAGAFIWANKFTGPGIDTAEDLIFGSSGALWVVGDYEDTIDFDPGPSAFPLISSGSTDIYIQKYIPCPSTNATISPTVCNSYTAPNGQVYTASGTYIATIANSTGCDSVITINLTVNTPPAQPGLISGASAPCQGSSQTYTLAPVPGATSYTWTLPSGWTGTSTSSAITTTAGSASGNITVTANNTCGSSAPQSLAISITPAPAQPGAISGMTSICLGSTNPYSIPTVPGATSYAWTLPNGWSGSSSSTSITATAGSTGGTISVTASNACGASASQTLPVTIVQAPAQPSGIAGASTICPGAASTYSVPAVPGAANYVWMLPSGWSGASTTNSITATSGTLSGTISVMAVNSCGSSAAQSLPVTVQTIPTQPASIAGETSICDGSTHTYMVAPVAGATSYTWTFPSGWTGTGSSNAVAATAHVFSGVVTVIANNACGSSAAQTLSVFVSPSPTAQFGYSNSSLTVNFADMSLGSPDAWYWDFGDGGTSVLQHPSHAYAVSGNYQVCLIASTNGCPDTLCQTVTVVQTGVAPHANWDVSVSPNPSSGLFQLKVDRSLDAQLIDVHGRVLWEGRVDAGPTMLDLNAQADGIYFLHLSDAGLHKRIRLAKVGN